MVKYGESKLNAVVIYLFSCLIVSVACLNTLRFVCLKIFLLENCIYSVNPSPVSTLTQRSQL